MPFDHLPVTVEVHVGACEIPVEDLLQLEPGNVLTLGRSAGETLDVLVSDVRVASAEVVILGARLAVRITGFEDEKVA